MNRCPHGVYSPDGDGMPSYACSGCFTPEPLPPGAVLSPIDSTPFAYEKRACPVCQNDKCFRYKNEYDWRCSSCGADALNN